ncbi:MAG: hypothetical protein K2J77_11105 [Oscillospiraceae bacterium]|nr:hypothetical protein [Oscillospiraceae bacterium]
MTKQEFLGAVNEIDDELIGEMLGAFGIFPEKTRTELYYDEPEVVCLTDKRVPFWKIAVSAAAAICVFFAGIFAAVKLRLIQLPEALTSEQPSAELSKPDDFSAPAESSAASEPVISEIPQYDGSFSFSLEGRDDLYYGVSGMLYNSNWQKPAVVTVNFGNLSATNKVHISITGDPAHPEDYVLSEEIIVDRNGEFEIHYNSDYVVELPVYLLVTTGGNVTFEGHWKP